MLKRIIAATAATAGMTGILLAGSTAPANAETCVSGGILVDEWNKKVAVCVNID